MAGPTPFATPAADAPDEPASAPGAVIAPAIAIGARLELSEELRVEWLRLAGALRDALHATVDLDAPPGRLRELADRAAQLATDLAGHAGGRTIPLASCRAESPADEALGALHPFGALSGSYNPLAPPLEVALENGHLAARVRLREAFQGAPGRVHGGVLAALFDEVLTLATIARGVPARVEQLSVRHHAPATVSEELRFEARVGRIQKRRVQVVATCTAGRVTIAEAEARCLRPAPDEGWTRLHPGASGRG